MPDLPVLKIGDPVMDAAQGRPMVVVGTPTESVAEWSNNNDYDLTENYGNARFGANPNEPVVRAVYVSDVRSEPSKDYTFPRSRLRLIDAHHADGGRRIHDRITFDVLCRLFAAVADVENVTEWAVNDVACRAGIPTDVVEGARELSEVDRVIGGEDGGD